MSLMENLLMGRTDPVEVVAEAVDMTIMTPDVSEMPWVSTPWSDLSACASRVGDPSDRRRPACSSRRPDLLVFDDVSSALDVETERILWERLFRDRTGVTSLVVSHRRPALQRADQIVVMEAARIVRGRKARLLSFEESRVPRALGGGGRLRLRASCFPFPVTRKNISQPAEFPGSCYGFKNRELETGNGNESVASSPMSTLLVKNASVLVTMDSSRERSTAGGCLPAMG